ncbi:MAG: type II toxin-antitoxin system VapC family toxin [Parvibaculaceae bacterium]
MTCFIDSNILIDIIDRDPKWAVWSESKVDRLAANGPLIINPIVYAEVSIYFDSEDEVERALNFTGLRREPLPWQAAFLAGRAFLNYRRRGGNRRSPLPDFYIGSHAAALGYTLLTRDPARYRDYFPGLQIVAPDTHP